MMTEESRETLFEKYFRRKTKKNQFEKTLLQLAVAPASLNVSMLSEEARGILEQYLRAVSAGRADILPVEGMEETCYKEALQIIREQKTPTAIPRIQSCTVEDYDRGIMYKVKSITYRVVYFIPETGNREERREMAVVFGCDERLGWLGSVEMG